MTKQKRILQTAALYLKHHPEEKRQPRFDVIEVVTDRENAMKALEIDHLLGAYEAGDLHAAF